MGKENEKWEADVLVCSKLRGRLFSLDKDKKKLVWGLSISQYGGIFLGQWWTSVGLNKNSCMVEEWEMVESSCWKKVVYYVDILLNIMIVHHDKILINIAIFMLFYWNILLLRYFVFYMLIPKFIRLKHGIRAQREISSLPLESGPIMHTLSLSRSFIWL